jgi:murein L,D-transpeptidase YafK
MHLSTSSQARIMKSRAKIITVLTLTVLISACTGHKSATTVSTATVKPMTQNRVDRTMPYLPLPGQRNVADILQTYGKYTSNKLDHYFTKAKVSYPPRDVTLIALKQEKKLELWARDTGEFRFIRDYYILAASGEAGPKLRQGDKQVPEGVYRITELNPNSHYHLSMKINYPNDFDLYHAEQDGRTDLGSDIFIHGKDASIGCLAMGDAAINELFVLAAQVGTNNVKVVIAPHDPRVYPLQANPEEFPQWTSELYSIISREIGTLSHLVKPAKTGL